MYKEKAREYIYQQIENKVNKLTGFRGTIEEIEIELQKIALRDNVSLEAFEENLEGNDLGYNTNLGEIEDTYFDFEIYLLKTNIEDIYIITETNRF